MKPSLWDLKPSLFCLSGRLHLHHEAIPMGFETLSFWRYCMPPDNHEAIPMGFETNVCLFSEK